MNSKHDDAELERHFRTGLARHAGDAPTELGAPLPGRADVPIPIRRRAALRWAIPAAAAVAVAAIPIASQLRDDPNVSAGPAATTSATQGTSASSDTSASTADPAARPAGIPADWRAESFAGVQVWVPPTWGWGGAPFAAEWNGGEVIDCSGGRAFTKPGSSDYEFIEQDRPYVGRPVMMTDACGGTGSFPEVDAVWLGAAVDVGTVPYADGWVRETREIGGITVTAFAKDAALREQLLSSAREVTTDANGCAAKADEGLPPAPAAAGTPTALSICVYSARDRLLLWSGTVGADRAADYDRATGADAPGTTAGAPPDMSKDFEIVRLGLQLRTEAGADSTRWDTYAMNAGVVWGPDAGAGFRTPITPANTDPWAKDNGGVKAYVVGPGYPKAKPFQDKVFRGILG